MLNDPVSGDAGMRGRLAAARDEGRLEALYAELTSDDAAIERGLAEGSLVRDERLRDFMRDCPDPLAGGGPRPTVSEPSAQELEDESAQLELDAAHVIARTSRMLQIRHDRAREQVRRLSKQVERLKAKAVGAGRRPSLRGACGSASGRRSGVAPTAVAS